MAGIIKVTPEQLDGVSAHLNTGAAAIEATLSQLAGQVAPLGEGWAGAGQARFQGLWEQWQSSSRSLHQALTDIGRLMHQASALYASNEAQIAASFGR